MSKNEKIQNFNETEEAIDVEVTTNEEATGMEVVEEKKPGFIRKHGVRIVKDIALVGLGVVLKVGFDALFGGNGSAPSADIPAAPVDVTTNI